MNALISVIVPVYNVESYLDKCIESLVSQTYHNLEIILVEDGAIDKSGQICDEWKEKDSRIIVIHQENCGAGVARNKALEIAKGDYITFVDSDDYISINMYEYLASVLEKNEEVDIVECNYFLTEDDSVLFECINKKVEMKKYSVEEAMLENIKDHIFRQLIWNKLYRRHIVQDLFFPVGKKIDDEFWTYQAIGRAKNLIHIDLKLYAYRQQENSVMHSISPDKRVQAIEAKVNRHNYICNRFPELVNESLVSLWFTCIYQIQIARNVMDSNNYKKTLDYIKRILRLYPMKYDKDIQLNLKQKCWLLLASRSIDLTCAIRNFLNVGL